MTTTTDTSSFGPEDVSPAAMRDFVKKAGAVMAELVADHNKGWHRYDPHVGCPGCLLASAGTREEE